MADRQAELRRLMKAERERQKNLTNDSPKPAVKTSALTAAPTPRGILRAPGKHSKIIGFSADPSTPKDAGKDKGTGLGGLIGDYGSDSGSDSEDLNHNREQQVQNETTDDANEHSSVAVVVGPSRPKIAFAPDVKMGHSSSITGTSRIKSTTDSKGVEELSAGTSASVASNNVGSDDTDGVDPNAWQEFQELVGDEHSEEAGDLDSKEAVLPAESKETSQDKEIKVHSARKGMLTSDDSAVIATTTGSAAASKPIIETTSTKKPKKKKKKKSSLAGANDPFVPSARSEAVEQAAYEARLARLMLLRSRSSKKFQPKEENGADGQLAQPDHVGEDAAAYAPALAFQEEAKDELCEESSTRSVEVDTKGKDINAPDKKVSKLVKKRKAPSSLAAQILRRKRTRAKLMAQADEEGVDDLGW